MADGAVQLYRERFYPGWIRREGFALAGPAASSLPIASPSVEGLEAACSQSGFSLGCSDFALHGRCGGELSSVEAREALGSAASSWEMGFTLW